MATIDAYGGKFIGNDFVVPRVRQQVRRTVAVPQPRYMPQPVYEVAVATETYEEPAADFDTQLAPARRAIRLPWLFTLRTGAIAASAVVLIAGLVVAVPHMPAAWSTAHRVASRVVLGAKVDMHRAPQHSFVMPQHSILVKNSQLSTFVDAIESQTITINVGSTTVTPRPIDIQKWFTTIAGPQKGSTIMQANTANISAYLTTLAQKNAPSTRFSDSSAAVSAATMQLAQSLLKYNGATVSLTNN